MALLSVHVLSSTFSNAAGPAPSSSSFFSGSQGDFQVNRGEARVTCRKTDIHPKFFSDAKVYCNGELVMTTGGTQGEYVVDVWSGNHPFYQGNKTALVLDADRVDKFKQRYAGLASLNTIPVLTKGEIVFERKKKAVKGKGKK
jgi:large subunit ribosomal protein L31